MTLVFFVGPNRTAGHIEQLVAMLFHHAETGGSQAGVNAKNSQGC
jgi:hypothetical protein